MVRPPVPVDPAVWWACAGCNVKIPPVGSSVFYFPEGNPQQCKIDTASSSTSRKYRSCRVVSINCMVDSKTDDIFARISLGPKSLPTNRAIQYPNDPPPAVLNSCSKMLTPSDANNGGGFSVPRLCAETILPPLDFNIENPVQLLNVQDLSGKVYPFRHIYRGTPKRHLFTSGWSEFVTDKLLVGGDTVTFIKKSPQEIFISVHHKNQRKKGEVKAAPVVAEVDAADGIFVVDYYPRNGAGFLVDEEVVVEAMTVRWSPGMRVRMRPEMSRTMWYGGSVEKVCAGSPWKMLKITWDDRELMQNRQNVSPWEVEIIPPMVDANDPMPAAKRTRISQISNNDFDNISLPLFNPVSTDLHFNPVSTDLQRDRDNFYWPLQPAQPEAVQNRILAPNGQENKRKSIRLFGQTIYVDSADPRIGDDHDNPKE